MANHVVCEAKQTCDASAVRGHANVRYKSTAAKVTQALGEAHARRAARRETERARMVDRMRDEMLSIYEANKAAGFIVETSRDTGSAKEDVCNSGSRNVRRLSSPGSPPSRRSLDGALCTPRVILDANSGCGARAPGPCSPLRQPRDSLTSNGHSSSFQLTRKRDKTAGRMGPASGADTASSPRPHRPGSATTSGTNRQQLVPAGQGGSDSAPCGPSESLVPLHQDRVSGVLQGMRDSQRLALAQEASTREASPLDSLPGLGLLGRLGISRWLSAAYRKVYLPRNIDKCG